MLVNSLVVKLFLNTGLQRQPGGPNICLTLYQWYRINHNGTDCNKLPRGLQPASVARRTDKEGI